MIECSRIISFDAAHRIMGHSNKCNNLHGHTYVIEASFRSNELTNLGMVVDFAIIKEVLGGWIDENWDHTTILFSEDNVLGSSIEAITNQKIYYMDVNPSAENMANYLLKNICPKIFVGHNVICSRIRLYETSNCYSEVFI